MTTATETRFELLRLEQLHESPLNPRKHFDPKKLEELTASVQAKGVQTPLIVRPNANGYEIAAGHRRFRAATAAELAEVPAFIREMTDDEFLELLNFENLLREDVHPLEEADGYRTLMAQAKYDVPSIAAKIGKSASYVYQRLKLADLGKPAREAFLKEEITAGHAILLARLQPKDQDEALKHCIDPNGYGYMRRQNGAGDRVACISVRDLGGWISQTIHLDLAKAPWAKDDAALRPTAGPCTTCPKRAGANPDLWPDVKKGDTCTDRTCYGEKLQAHVKVVIEKLQADGKKVMKLREDYAHSGHKSEGVLHRDEWERSEAKKGHHVICEHTAVGVFIDGPRAGQTLRLCLNSKCTHHRAVERTKTGSGREDNPDVQNYRAQERAKEQRAKRENKRRLEILKAIRLKATGLPGRKALELVALGFWDDIWHEHRKRLAALHGWDSPETPVKEIAKLEDADLGGLLISLAVAKELHVSGYEVIGTPKKLMAMAELYKVDVAKLDHQLKLAEAEKPVKKKSAGQPADEMRKSAQTSAKKKTRR